MPTPIGDEDKDGFSLLLPRSFLCFVHKDDVSGDVLVQLVNGVKMPVPCKERAADVHTGCGNPYVIDGDLRYPL
jgi:hypothetical protein